MGEEHTKELVKKSEIIHDEKNFVAALHDSPATLGHSIIVSKEHATIFEQVPDPIIGSMFKFANKLSVTLFEQLQAHGTNIIVENGLAAGQKEPYFAVNVIPRREGDGLNFEWQPQQMSEDELSTVELQLKEQTENIGAFDASPAEPLEVKDDAEVVKAEDDDYLIKQLDRLP